MPEVTIGLLEGRTLEQKRGLVRDMTEAVVRNCGVRPEDVTIIIHDNLKSDSQSRQALFRRLARNAARPSLRAH